ncbi:MAG TPA: RNA-binding S4 domain-containing protein [Fimbriimonadaceae bacterium]|nr:RNA-binding S4 domain-containing protein [Fimbriimonadaceae bacterium]HRJ33603.1 RNA-binding S4 domain-containing protein [Fimbriimonadaceae bacterium]
MPEPSIFELRTEFITLGQFLKAAGMVDEGWQAREFLQREYVRVNGEPENRRGRKLRPGDLVEWNGQTFEIQG